MVKRLSLPSVLSKSIRPLFFLQKRPLPSFSGQGDGQSPQTPLTLHNVQSKGRGVMNKKRLTVLFLVQGFLSTAQYSGPIEDSA